MNRIKELRTSLGMTREKLSKKIGIHINSLTAYENNTRAISTELIEKIAVNLEVQPAWLAGWSENQATVIEKVRVIDYDERMAEIERENAYLQRRLQSREYSLTLHSWTLGGKMNEKQTIHLDEENLIALIYAAAQGSCGFDKQQLPYEHLEHLHCCDYNEPIYEVLKQIDLAKIEEDTNKTYLQKLLAKGKELYDDEGGKK